MNQKISELKNEGFINRDELDKAFKACIQEYLLNFELLETNQYWHTVRRIEHKKVYLFIYRAQGELQYHYFLKRETLSDFTSNSAFSPELLSLLKWKGSINRLDRILILSYLN